VLAGENRDLTRRLAATQDEIEALRSRLAAVEASSGKPKQEAPTTKSRDGGGTPAPETVMAEATAFRKKVLTAIAPELAGLGGRLASAEARLATTVTKSEYAKHKHTFVKASHGWATKPVIDACDGCLLPYLPPSKQGATAVISTSEPK
jgi:hypothetical protein